MKLFKNLMIVLSVSLLLWGCSDDDESINNGNSTISLSTNILQVDKNGGDATVTVTSSDNWRLSGICDWAHPSITSGKDGDVVTFTIDPNKLDEKRTATFKFFTGSSVVPLQVESQPAYIMDLLSDEALSITKEKSTVRIQLNTNVTDPTITYSDGGEEWLTFDRRNEFGGKVTLSFTAAENKTYKDRSTKITISSPLVTESVNVDINQKQTDAIITESNTLTYDLTARTISLKVKYNVNYAISITKGKDWITDQSISEPQKGDDGLTTVTVTYKLSASPASRGGTIHIAQTSGTLVKDIAIVQKDPDASPVEIPDAVLRALCISNGWALPIDDTKCIILEEGLNATSFSNTSYSNQIKDLTGIQYFPNLTSLRLGYCSNMKKLDISGLHKVSSLTFNSPTICEEYNLGDNPITSFNAGGSYVYSEAESLKVISSKLESLDLSLVSWYASYDNVTSIDASECPALTTLNANRSSKIKTLYLKTGQVIPKLTKNDATTIVYK